MASKSRQEQHKDCRHQRFRCRPHCYGYDELWMGQAQCVDCGKRGQVVRGFTSKAAARTGAIEKFQASHVPGVE